MKKYFNIYLEFDKDKVDQIIHDTIIKKGKGFVCSVEANNLTVANKNPDFLRVVNGALVNICDGSMLAKILGFIHNRNFSSYLGADLFLNYVMKCQYKQYFLGNTRQVLNGLRDNLTEIDSNIVNLGSSES
jgi:N-acetylglucosaminyldiphosphoundecaprenol N-acetyl-beta-D-mannosaminyltransferase